MRTSRRLIRLSLLPRTYHGMTPLEDTVDLFNTDTQITITQDPDSGGQPPSQLVSNPFAIHRPESTLASSGCQLSWTQRLRPDVALVSPIMTWSQRGQTIMFWRNIKSLRSSSKALELSAYNISVAPEGMHRMYLPRRRSSSPPEHYTRLRFCSSLVSDLRSYLNRWVFQSSQNFRGSGRTCKTMLRLVYSTTVR